MRSPIPSNTRRINCSKVSKKRGQRREYEIVEVGSASEASKVIENQRRRGFNRFRLATKTGLYIKEFSF